MPNRVLFQVGKNHVHPFTMFVGGFVIGTMVTAVVAWGWFVANDVNDVEDSFNVTTVPAKAASPKPKVTPSPVVSAQPLF